jgi:Tfp pilus assembly protein PilV
MIARRRLRTRSRDHAAPHRRRDGFALIEVMVATVLFAVATLGLAAMSIAVARRAVTSAASTARAAAMGQQLDRLQAIPYDSLAARAGCTSIAMPPLPHTRCITITTLPNNKIQVRLTVTPTDPKLRPDTTTFTRAKGAKNNPLL